MFGILGALLLAFVIGVVVSDDEPATSPGDAGPSIPLPTATPPRPTVTPFPTATPGPSPTPRSTSFTSSASYESMAISIIKEERQVLDAAISQSGDQLSLVLIVSAATNSRRAQQLGENFVRLVKTLSPDDPPGRQVGTGTYDYLIGVYYPNEKPVARGAKVSFARDISW